MWNSFHATERILKFKCSKGGHWQYSWSKFYLVKIRSVNPKLSANFSWIREKRLIEGSLYIQHTYSSMYMYYYQMLCAQCLMLYIQSELTKKRNVIKKNNMCTTMSSEWSPSSWTTIHGFVHKTVLFSYVIAYTYTVWAQNMCIRDMIYSGNMITSIFFCSHRQIQYSQAIDSNKK